jgi:hypothetical protein
MTGNFFLVCRTDSKMPPELGGDSESISFTGYDADKKVYTDTGFDSQGASIGQALPHLAGGNYDSIRSYKNSR